MSKRRTVGLIIMLVVVMLLLTGCGVPTTHDPNAPPQNLWEAAIVFPMAQALMWIHGVLESIKIPYAYGFAIIIFTILIKIVTLPLTFQQLRSMKATQEIQPRLQELQKKYGKDREKLAAAQMELYKEAGVNPLGGCLPLLIQMPILFGLYQALYYLAGIGELINQPFLWIPDLSFPHQATGIGWITEYWTNGQIGTLVGYLILPVLLVASQMVLQRMSQPPKTGDSQDPQQAMMGQMMLFMPLMFGFFALQVPSGLSVYWVVSNLLAMVQQYFVTGWGSLNLPGINVRDALTPATNPPSGSDTSLLTPSSTGTNGSEPLNQPRRRRRKRK